MATAYADMFEYAQMSIITNTCTIEYTDVTLLKDMCKKKAGVKITKIVLNPKTGNFTIPRAKKIPAPVPVPAPVEFKGVHTRFDSEPEKKKKKCVSKKKDETVFKVYKGRNVYNVVDKHDEAFEDIIDKIDDILGGTEVLGGIITPKVCHVNDDGCIVVRGKWDEYFDTKTRYKSESGTYDFKLKTKKDEEVYITVFKVYSGRKIHKVVDKNDEAFDDVVETVSGILNIYGYDFKNHFSVNDDGCIVLCGRWDDIDTKTRHKTEYGNFAFKRIV